mmetsp:Transcript_40699/g.95725  ORF Transcript_40699/g.95725 Transcript_40699/m.95725 type:complete len:305 (+) Transcript_40699:482-1396(+)
MSFSTARSGFFSSAHCTRASAAVPSTSDHSRNSRSSLPTHLVGRRPRDLPAQTLTLSTSMGARPAACVKRRSSDETSWGRAASRARNFCCAWKLSRCWWPWLRMRRRCSCWRDSRCRPSAHTAVQAASYCSMSPSIFWIAARQAICLRSSNAAPTTHMIPGVINSSKFSFWTPDSGYKMRRLIVTMKPQPRPETSIPSSTSRSFQRNIAVIIAPRNPLMRLKGKITNLRCTSTSTTRTNWQAVKEPAAHVRVGVPHEYLRVSDHAAMARKELLTSKLSSTASAKNHHGTEFRISTVALRLVGVG